MSRTARASKPRLNVELTEAQSDELGRLVPHGLRKLIYTAFTEDLINVLKDPDRGRDFLGIIVARRVELTSLVREKS